MGFNGMISWDFMGFHEFIVVAISTYNHLTGNAAPLLQVAIGSDVLVQCPYLDCSRTYRVRRRDFRCRIVRCGAALCRGREYQLPKHGTREQVRNWLQESWGWDDWNLGIILEDLYLFYFYFLFLILFFCSVC